MQNSTSSLHTFCAAVVVEEKYFAMPIWHTQLFMVKNAIEHWLITAVLFGQAQQHIGIIAAYYERSIRHHYTTIFTQPTYSPRRHNIVFKPGKYPQGNSLCGRICNGIEIYIAGNNLFCFSLKVFTITFSQYLFGIASKYIIYLRLNISLAKGIRLNVCYTHTMLAMLLL